MTMLKNREKWGEMGSESFFFNFWGINKIQNIYYNSLKGCVNL